MLDQIAMQIETTCQVVADVASTRPLDVTMEVVAINRTRSRSLALEDRRSFVEKRLDALFEVVAKKCRSPHRLD